MKLLFFISLWFFLASSVSAKDKLVRCEGTYPYTYTENISHAEAKAKAVENAIIMALADEFGTTVTSQSLMELENGKDRFDQMSRLQVKGKLVRHIHEPEISSPLLADNLFSIQVKVDFYARPIVYAPTEFEAYTLRNGTEKKFESLYFQADDKFYLLFQSPKAGYLAVFFEDRSSVVCMLPYVQEDEAPFWVEKEKSYLLFNVRNNTYHMSCGEEPEINYVHVIFSPRKFIDGDLVREMSCKKFREWLGTRQSYDDKMQVNSMMIKVHPNRHNQ